MGENDGINYTSSSASFGMAGTAKIMSLSDKFVSKLPMVLAIFSKNAEIVGE